MKQPLIDISLIFYKFICPSGKSAKDVFEHDEMKKSLAMASGFNNYFSVFSDEIEEKLDEILSYIDALQFNKPTNDM